MTHALKNVMTHALKNVMTHALKRLKKIPIKEKVTPTERKRLMLDAY